MEPNSKIFDLYTENWQLKNIEDNIQRIQQQVKLFHKENMTLFHEKSHPFHEKRQLVSQQKKDLNFTKKFFNPQRGSTLMFTLLPENIKEYPFNLKFRPPLPPSIKIRSFFKVNPRIVCFTETEDGNFIIKRNSFMVIFFI